MVQIYYFFALCNAIGDCPLLHLFDLFSLLDTFSKEQKGTVPNCILPKMKYFCSLKNSIHCESIKIRRLFSRIKGEHYQP